MAGFDHQEIEKKAQEKWAAAGIFTTNLSDSAKEPYYLLVEFPYPSGDLHIGHWYAFAIPDIYARILRMRGKNVLFPVGFDAFGLPAENAAIKNGADPAVWTKANIERMRGQLQSMGASFDWSKEVIACDPTYYQWTQWLFAKLFEHNLAYRAEASVKWCPKDQTVLANEQVIDGRCERCGTEVVEKRLTQWFLKITEYADRLLKDLEPLPWREEIKEAQRAWIGKSEGAKIHFLLDFKKHPEDSERRGPNGERAQLTVFTTRPDTIYGATYLVLAPEHLWVTLATDADHDVLENKEEVKAYANASAKKTERERSENKEKTGVELKGVKAINPATQEEIPIFVADYVLGSYGTGAVMAVPAHDERDYEFAQKYDLPIRQVVEPSLVQTVGSSAFKANEPYVEHRGIIAIVKHWSDDTYLALAWKAAPDWGTLLTGTIDENMSPEATVLKEIHEETGYRNPKIVRELGTMHGKYFHAPKQKNRFAHAPAFYVELTNGDRDPVAEEERQKHVLHWLTLDELKRFLTPFSHQVIVSIFEKGFYTRPGIFANSGVFTGRDSEEAKDEIIASVGGEKTTNYRLRDWLVSRQRYWGCPIPIVYDPEGKPHLVPAEHLPWLLPTDVDFKPNGQASPFASSKELRERVTTLFGEGWTPEFDTLDTFVDSSWYFLRYLDPKDAHDFSDASLMKKWLPINRYSGGSEQTTMHLLYARFFQKALYDLALVPTNEPFEERFNRGIILGPDGNKMSKSKGNVINPDEFVAKYGADAVRIYLAFIGPYNEPGHYPWNLDGVASMRKFLERVVRMTEKAREGETSSDLSRALGRTAKKVTEDCDRFKFNTAIAALMTLLNTFEGATTVSKSAARNFTILLAPFAPHLAEELFERLGGEGLAATTLWPQSAAIPEDEIVEVAVQVAGRKRGSIRLSPAATEADALAAALEVPAVAAALAGDSPSRVVYVPGRILNLVR